MTRKVLIGYYYMITVIESAQFITKAAKIMSATEKDRLVDFIARNPMDGDLIPGTGGVRKIRFAIGGKGKSSGLRVIYYFYNTRNPLLLFTAFGKNERSDLSEKEKQTLYGIVQEIKKRMRK